MCHFISDNSFHISPKYTYQPPLCRIQHWLICYLATSEKYQTFCYSSWSIHQINLLFSQHIAQHMLFLLRAPRITCWYLAHWLTSFLRFYHLSSSLWYSSELVRPWKTIHLRVCHAYTTSLRTYCYQRIQMKELYRQSHTPASLNISPQTNLPRNLDCKSTCQIYANFIITFQQSFVLT